VNKIPTIFVRAPLRRAALVINEWVPGTEWVRDGEGVATRKWDGTSVLIRNGKRYKRRELRQGDATPPDFESLGTDENTGKTVGWVPVGDGPEDRWHREALDPGHDGTFELVGPKVQGNKDKFNTHTLVAHGHLQVDAPRDFVGLKQWLSDFAGEGLVWHHPDGRMAKIKRRDFGFKW
jgi:hypothetical protein